MPIKVVAGAEPENTNLFLIALAEVALDSTIDGSEAVKRCLNGEEPGRGPIPRRKVRFLFKPLSHHQFSP